MATKNEIFNKLVESNVLLEDANISDFTKNELVSLIQDDIKEEPLVEEQVVIQESSVKEEKALVEEEFIKQDVYVPKSRFEISSSFKPVYRINTFKKGSDPVIKISPSVYEHIKSHIHIDDICDTSVEKQLKSIVYHIRTQPTRYITVSSKPDELVRCHLVNDVLMSYIV